MLVPAARLLAADPYLEAIRLYKVDSHRSTCTLEPYGMYLYELPIATVEH